MTTQFKNILYVTLHESNSVLGIISHALTLIIEREMQPLQCDYSYIISKTPSSLPQEKESSNGDLLL